MAAPVNPNLPRELTKLLAQGDLQLNRLETEQAVLTFCKAYAWDPCVTQTHLNTLPQEIFGSFVCALEDYCVWGFDSGRQLPVYDVDLSLEHLCDWIITANMKPKSNVAWSVKVNIQMQRKDYVGVIESSSQVFELFPSKPTWFFVMRAVAQLHLRQEEDALRDFLSAFSGNQRETKDYILETLSSNIKDILRLFYEAVDKAKKKTSDKNTSADTNEYIINCLQFVLSLIPSDIESYLECAAIFTEQHMYKDAVILLSDAIENASQDTDILRACLQRAEGYLSMHEVELSVYDYLKALRIDEVSTISSISSLPSSQQGSIVCHANHFADCIVNDYRTQNKVCNSCSFHPQVTRDQLSLAHGCYRLLYMLDSTNLEPLLHGAECLMLQNNYVQALDVYSQIVSQDPKSTKARCGRGRCYVSLGDFTNALRDFDQAISIEPTNEHALCERMRALVLAGQIDRGVLDMARAAANGRFSVVVNYIKELSFDERDALCLRLKGYFMSFLKCSDVKCNTDQLCAVGEVLIRTCHNDLELHLVYVEILLLLDKEDEAQSILVRLMATNPSSYHAHVHLAVLKMRLGKTHNAIQELRRVLQMVGEEKLAEALKEVKIKLKTISMIGKESFMKGVKSRESSEKIELFTLAIVVSPEASWTCYWHRGKQYLAKSRMDLALHDFTAALNNNPKHVPSYLLRSVVWMHRKQWKQCMWDLSAALNINSKALVQIIQKLPRATKQVVLEVIFHGVQGYFSVYNSRRIKSECILQLSLLLVELDSSVALYHSTLADAYLVFEDYKQALRELEITNRLSSTLDTFVIGRQGLAYVQLGNYMDAAVSFSTISNIDPSGLEYLLHCLNSDHCHALVVHALLRGDELICEENHCEAVLYLNVAVVASQGRNPQILRKRCECLKSLGSFALALDDITKIIHSCEPTIEDYCNRASLHVHLDDLPGACTDLSKALDINDNIAIDVVTQQHPDVDPAAVFYQVALCQYNDKKRFNAIKSCKYGLKYDHNNQDLIKLKQKLEADMSRCLLQ